MSVESHRQRAMEQTIPAIEAVMPAAAASRREAALQAFYDSLVNRMSAARGMAAFGLSGPSRALSLGEEAERAVDVAVSSWLRDEGLDPRTMPVRLLGALHEGLLDSDDGSRKKAGAFYTPAPLIDEILECSVRPVLDAACERLPEEPSLAHLPRVLDPAMGSGHFLTAAAAMITRRLALLHDAHGCLRSLLTTDDEGGVRRLVLSHCICGVDVDPLAAALCEAALRLDGGVDVGSLEHLRVLDSLRTPRTDWEQAFPGAFDRASPGFDAVIGNPPFQSQLSQSTARSRELAAFLREAFGDASGAYTDSAAVFLLLGVSLTRDGGFTSMVQPQSLLGTRDAGGVRRACLARASLSSMWLDDGPVFADADVRVCAPCLHAGGHHDGVDVRVGAPATRRVRCADAPGDSWSPLLAAAMGVPRSSYGVGRIADLAEVTADFRDQYYDLAPMVLERDDAADVATCPLLTTGLVDLASCLWGVKPARYAKKRWQAPVVDVRRVASETVHGAWLERRLGPKIIVATQTNVIELLIDDEGVYLPMTPLITVTPREGVSIWALGAALACPPAAAAAAWACAGTGMSTSAIKLSATQVRELAAPDLHHPAMVRAGEALRAASKASSEHERVAHLLVMAAEACAACGVDNAEELTSWWRQRGRFDRQ